MQKILPLTFLFLFFFSSVAEAQRRAPQQPQSNSRDARLSAIAPANNPRPVAPQSTPVQVGGALKSSEGVPETGLTHPRNHVLLIGVNHYRLPEPVLEGQEHLKPVHFSDLRFCVKDMEGLKSALVRARFCTEEDIRLVVSGAGGNLEPTRANIESAFTAMLQRIEQGDRVLVAFSGHGIALPLDGNPGVSEDHLACADAKVIFDDSPLNKRFTTKEGIISRSKLEETLDASQAGTKLVFIDACRNLVEGSDSTASDSVADGARGSIGGLPKFGEFNAIYSNVRNPHGVLFRLSSCSPREISQEHRALEHGVFTHFLIQGLRGAAPQRHPGRITLQDLHSYVRRSTREYVEREVPASAYKTSQTPTMVMLPVEGRADPDEIVIAYYSEAQSRELDRREALARQLAIEQQRNEEIRREREANERALAEQQRLEREQRAEQARQQAEQQRIQREQRAEQARLQAEQQRIQREQQQASREQRAEQARLQAEQQRIQREQSQQQQASRVSPAPVTPPPTVVPPSNTEQVVAVLRHQVNALSQQERVTNANITQIRRAMGAAPGQGRSVAPPRL